MTIHGNRRTLIGGLLAATAATSALVGRNAEAAPADVGQMSALYPWPNVSIHTTLLSDGRILSWADDDRAIRGPDFSKVYIVTIQSGGGPLTSTYLPNNTTNLFCAGQVHLPNGNVLVVGGHEEADYYGSTDINLFRPKAGGGYEWVRLPQSMMKPRWYPSTIPLGNGDVLIMSGEPYGQTTRNDLPQVWKTSSGGGFRNLTNARFRWVNYPRIVRFPNDNRVLVASPNISTRILDTTDAGTLTVGPQHVVNVIRYETVGVLFAPGMYLIAGGGNPSTGTAEIIDLNEATPRWAQIPSMINPRHYANGVFLPDGTMFMCGGTRLRGNTEAGAVLPTELWNPVTGSWSLLPNIATPRLYHSCALLMPDGRVLITGGGRGASAEHDYYTAQFYSPAYLFRGPRPVISAPGAIKRGQAFSITASAATVASLRLIKLPAVTHGDNMDQATAPVSFTGSGTMLTATVTDNMFVLPVGHYMLFGLTASGIPSIARIVQLT